MAIEISDEVSLIQRTTTRFRYFNKISDFANVFKAFIGCNYLSMPFAFKQSGMILGIIGLIIIAYITDHCCHLIVKCKHAAIEQIMAKTTFPVHSDDNSYNEVERQKRKRRIHLEQIMTYGDIGQLTMGKWGSYIVNTALVITQFSFCVNYFIFMGDTFTRLYPLAPHNATHKQNITENYLRDPQLEVKHKGVPNVILLMLIPFPLFLLQTLVRKLRNLGPLSAVANFCVFIGFFSILGFILHGMDYNNIHRIDLWQFTTFPIFFGQLIGAYEGIGTIIPIEASMSENRPSFPCYLHGAILLVSIILGSFGIFGYLHFTDGVEQLISDNLPYGTLSTIVRITLCVGILFTYPLQIFPVVEIFENFLFKETKEHNMMRNSIGREYDREYDSLLPPNEGQNNILYGDIVNDTEQELVNSSQQKSTRSNQSKWHCEIYAWSTWKRNIFRLILVSMTFGVAYVCRNYYAYVSALSGSIGSSLLAFILPCAFHFILTKDHISAFVIAKDIFLILFGIIAGIVGFVTTLIKMIKH